MGEDVCRLAQCQALFVSNGTVFQSAVAERKENAYGERRLEFSVSGGRMTVPIVLARACEKLDTVEKDMVLASAVELIRLRVERGARVSVLPEVAFLLAQAERKEP